MSSIKNPENEAEKPAPMPRQTQDGKKAKMAPHPTAPPGLEQDARGNAIWTDKRHVPGSSFGTGGSEVARTIGA
jgi:hypothetical protein